MVPCESRHHRSRASAGSSSRRRALRPRIANGRPPAQRNCWPPPGTRRPRRCKEPGPPPPRAKGGKGEQDPTRRRPRHRARHWQIRIFDPITRGGCHHQAQQIHEEDHPLLCRAQEIRRSGQVERKVGEGGHQREEDAESHRIGSEKPRIPQMVDHLVPPDQVAPGTGPAVEAGSQRHTATAPANIMAPRTRNGLPASVFAEEPGGHASQESPQHGAGHVDGHGLGGVPFHS